MYQSTETNPFLKHGKSTSGFHIYPGPAPQAFRRTSPESVRNISQWPKHLTIAKIRGFSRLSLLTRFEWHFIINTLRVYWHLKRWYKGFWYLNHWGQATHICASTLPLIDSSNGLTPGRRRVIIWTQAELLLIEPLGTNVSDILVDIYTFSSKKMLLKMSSWKLGPFCLGLQCICLPHVRASLQSLKFKMKQVCQMVAILSRSACAMTRVVAVDTLCNSMLTANLHRLISAAIGRWVTSDQVELPFIPWWKKLCTSAVEYNP